MGKVKYDKIVVVKYTNTGKPEIRDIIYTFLKDIPHIKYGNGLSHRLIFAGNKYIPKIISKIWWTPTSPLFSIERYCHYSSDGGYCHFYTPANHSIIAVRSKDLKILWD